MLLTELKTSNSFEQQSRSLASSESFFVQYVDPESPINHSEKSVTRQRQTDTIK